MLPERLAVHVSHQQSVVELPAEAVKLATGDSDIVQAFRLGEKTWGVQFHPESILTEHGHTMMQNFLNLSI